MDDTYRLGETHAAADKALFRKRAMQHLRGRLS
jgi:hypothetical protein